MNGDTATYYLIAHGAVTVLVLRQLLVIERRMGKGDFLLERLKKHCKLFNGAAQNQEGDCEK